MNQQGKIKVLEAIRQGKIGGGESHVLDLVAGLDKTKFDPVVLSFTDGPMIIALETMGIPVRVIDSQKAFDLRVWKRVKQLLQQENVDIVHVHGTRANTNVLWAARSLQLPVIYTVHGWSFHEGLPPWQKRARIAAEKYITSKTNVNICVSEANRQTGLQAFGKFNSIVVPNGVNLKKFDPVINYPDVKAAYGIPEHHLVVGYIARMTLQKDPVGMIRAFAQVRQWVSPITLLMIGDGELKKAAMDTARQLGLDGHVIFDGFRQDVPAVLQAVDIYCLPSLWEGFPIGLLEAMAMGKAVIASDVDGTREALKHDENGLLVPAQDPSILATAIIRLATDDMLRYRLQQKARATVQSTYNVSNMTRKIEDIYKKVVIDN